MGKCPLFAPTFTVGKLIIVLFYLDPCNEKRVATYPPHLYPFIDSCTRSSLSLPIAQFMFTPFFSR